MSASLRPVFGAGAVEADRLHVLHGERYAGGQLASRRGLYEHHLRVLRRQDAVLRACD